MQPVVSVIIVSDYAGGGAKAWDDLRRSLTALARQDIDEPVETLLMESREHAERAPDDLRPILPSLKVVAASATGSYELKSAGVCAAAGDLVVILDANCTRARDWLRRAV